MPAGTQNDPALDAAGNVYLENGTTLDEYNPSNGSVVRSLPNQSFAAGTTPVLTSQYLFADDGGNQTIYNLSDLSVANTLGTTCSFQYYSSFERCDHRRILCRSKQLGVYGSRVDRCVCFTGP